MLMMATRHEPEIIPELLRVEEVAALVGLGVRTVWGLVAEKEFPRPVKVGRLSRWRRSAVEAWMDGLEEA